MAKCALVHGVFPSANFKYPSKRHFVGKELKDMLDALVFEGGVTEAEHLCFFQCLGCVLPFNQMGGVVDA